MRSDFKIRPGTDIVAKSANFNEYFIVKTTTQVSLSTYLISEVQYLINTLKVFTNK